MKSPAAFLIGGTASGSGKTTLTLGIMAALKARGLRVQPFKCGPDFIDPSLHHMVTGEISSNLDLRMCGRIFCHETFERRLMGKDVAVVEGVMGLFDGGIASSAALACELGLPVILVVDARSAAESVAAVVKGFEVFRDDVSLVGVIFNRVASPRHRTLIERGMAGVCKSRILGFMPRDVRFEIPDRHLGLHMGTERPLDDTQLEGLIQSVEQHIDLDQLLRLAWQKDPVSNGGRIKVSAPLTTSPIRLAVARDAAFCFYYEDNLEMLSQAGVELVSFSPLVDGALPPDCQGVYLGGGYPELHAATLSANSPMRESVRSFGEAGGIIYGECGGFMYLCQEIVASTGASYPMSALFSFRVRMKQRLSRLGYRKPQLVQDCFLGQAGQELHGHEFHYSELIDLPKEKKTLFRLEGGREEGYCSRNVIGGYIHIHFARSASALQIFLRRLAMASVLTEGVTRQRQSSAPQEHGQQENGTGRQEILKNET